MTVRRAPLLAALLLVAAGLSGCGEDTAAPAGEPVPGSVGVDVAGEPRVVHVPAADLTFTVGEASTDAVDGGDTADGDDLTPPEGGSLVPVAVEVAPAGVPAAEVVGSSPEATEVVVEVDGEEVPLPAPYDVEGSQVTASSAGTFFVPAEVPDPAVLVHVSYDGHTQTLDPATGEVDAGVADLWYAGPGGGPGGTADETDCETTARGPAASDPGLRVECAATARRLPYLPGEGWAEDGSAFALVDYRWAANRVPGHEVREVADVTTRVGRRTPLTRVRVPDTSGTLAPWVGHGADVHRVTAEDREVVLRAAFVLARQGERGGAAGRLVVTGTVPLPPA